MLWTQEKRMLYFLAAREYTGEGAIADMGSFLGGSTVCLAAGLEGRSFEPPLIHAYDLFQVGTGASQRYFPEGTPPETSTLDDFKRNLGEHIKWVKIQEGDLLSFSWEDGPLEILFVDIAKSYKAFDHILLNYFPALIPGESLVILQDYLSPQTGPWHHIVMERLSSYFRYIVDCGSASVVFRLERAIPRRALLASQWTEIPYPEKLDLMESAITKLDSEEKRDFLRSNLEILLQGKDLTWGMHYHDQT